MDDEIGDREDSADSAAAPRRDDVIASVVERLRTPLTALKGWNELARRRLCTGQTDEVDALLARAAEAIIDMQKAIDVVAAEGRARSAFGPARVGQEATSEDVSAPVRHHDQIRG